MKKTIGKPQNWQDFESLCKKLWGEIWEIPNKIKKNGRLGQEQAGVDVYGIPKGEKQYWGIQCKGKDDYTNAKLTETEIIKEIEKARKFQPPLRVYIIASTTNKDSKIEQFVRLKDIESQKIGSFEILLFCWEDIVDLIEENRDTYNWYQHGIGQKGKFDFKISFNELEDSLILKPIFEKEIKQYKLIETIDLDLFINPLPAPTFSVTDFNPLFPFNSNKINKSWCNFDLVMENTGSSVIEDWRLDLRFIKGVSRLDEGSFLIPKLSSTTFVYDKNKTIAYKPKDNSPLIQKDNRYFNISLLPDPKSELILMEWELLARDFNRKELVEIPFEPEYIENIRIIEVYDRADLKEDKISITYHVIERKKKEK